MEDIEWTEDKSLPKVYLGLQIEIDEFAWLCQKCANHNKEIKHPAVGRKLTCKNCKVEFRIT